MYLAGAEEELKLRLLEPRAALSDQGGRLEEFSVNVVEGKPLQLHIGRLGKGGRVLTQGFVISRMRRTRRRVRRRHSKAKIQIQNKKVPRGKDLLPT